MRWVLLIAVWAAQTPEHQGITARLFPTRRDCDAARVQVPPSDSVRWTACVLVVQP